MSVDLETIQMRPVEQALNSVVGLAAGISPHAIPEAIGKLVGEQADLITDEDEWREGRLEHRIQDRDPEFKQTEIEVLKELRVLAAVKEQETSAEARGDTFQFSEHLKARRFKNLVDWVSALNLNLYLSKVSVDYDERNIDGNWNGKKFRVTRQDPTGGKRESEARGIQYTSTQTSPKAKTLFESVYPVLQAVHRVAKVRLVDKRKITPGRKR